MLHGHNGRVHFTVRAKRRDAKLDFVGRVLDFSSIGTLLCGWVETAWDHRFLVWEQDPWATRLEGIDRAGVVLVPFNPTAENMADYLLRTIGPRQLAGSDVELCHVTVWETRKCEASAALCESLKP